MAFGAYEPFLFSSPPGAGGPCPGGASWRVTGRAYWVRTRPESQKSYQAEAVITFGQGARETGEHECRHHQADHPPRRHRHRSKGLQARTLVTGECHVRLHLWTVGSVGTAAGSAPSFASDGARSILAHRGRRPPSARSSCDSLYHRRHSLSRAPTGIHADASRGRGGSSHHGGDGVLFAQVTKADAR